MAGLVNPKDEVEVEKDEQFLYEITFPQDARRRKHQKKNQFNAGVLELQKRENSHEWMLTVIDGELEQELSFTLATVYQFIHQTPRGNGANDI